MEYRYIGTSGLRVTPICLGTMTLDKCLAKRALKSWIKPMMQELIF